MLVNRAARRSIAASIGFGLALAGIGVGLMVRSEPTSDSRGAARGRLTIPVDRYCLGEGQTVSLDELPTIVPYPVLVPNQPLANASNLTDVVWCPAGSGVSMKFSTGVQIYSWPNEISDPEQLWNKWATEEAPGIIAVGAVRGTQGALADAAKDPRGRSLGAVEWVEEGITHQVAGNGEIALADLLAVAESMQAIRGPIPSPTP